MRTAFQNDQFLDSLRTGDCSDQGWYISFRLAPGIMPKGIDPHAMLDQLANMGTCRVIGRDKPLPARAYPDPCSSPINWDMVLVGDTTRAAIELVFVDMPDTMELLIEPIY